MSLASHNLSKVEPRHPDVIWPRFFEVIEGFSVVILHSQVLRLRRVKRVNCEPELW